MDRFRLDRSAFKGQTLEEAANHAEYYRKLSWQERLRIANYLNSVAFNFDLENPPALDRTKFSTKSLEAL